MRLAVTGSAGTGKTTLVQALSAELGAPVVPEGMREVLEEEGLELHSLSPSDLKELILKLWADRRGREQASAFISDRSSLDFVAFWLLYRFEWAADTERQMKDFIEHSLRYHHVVVLPHGGLPLEDDGVRSPNRWTQLHFQLLLEGVLRRYLPAERLHWMPLGLRDLDQRLAWVRARTLGGDASLRS